MPDLVLKTRLDALEKNFQVASDVLKLVKERRAEIQELRSLLEDIQESIDAVEGKISSYNNALRREEKNLELEKGYFSVILNTQVEALNEVHQVKEFIDSAWYIIQKMQKRSVEIEGKEIGATLVATAATEIKTKADDCNTILEGIHEMLKEAIEREKGGDKSKAENLRADAWKNYADKDNELARQRVFEDYVDFLRGLAMRDADLDEGICKIADELISKLQIRDLSYSLTIPAFQEAVTMTLARFIRLGFPEWTLWALPLAAHELGHVVVSKNLELDTFVKENASNELSAYGLHLQEFLADAFATFTMGPAYACASILLRFNPPSAYEDKKEHPADAKRAYVIFKMLEWMNESKNEQYEGIIKILKDEWSDALKQAKQQDKLKAEDENNLNKWIDSLKEKKLVEYISSVRYPHTSWARAELLKKQLLDVLQKKQNNIEVSGTYDLRDVLNAAWLCRIDQLTKTEDIHKARTEDIHNEARKLWDDILIHQRSGALKGKELSPQAGGKPGAKTKSEMAGVPPSVGRRT
jgi:hypothetical protein